MKNEQFIPNGFSFLENSFRCGVLTNDETVTEKDFNTPQYALVYLTEGKGSYSDQEGKKWDLRSGDLFQRFPHIPHGVILSPRTIRSYLAVPREIYELIYMTENRFLSKPVHSLGNRSDISEGFRQLLQLCEKEKNLYSLALTFQNLIRQCMLAAEEYVRREENSLESRLIMASELLAEKLNEPLSIKEVAASAGLNYHTFRRQFSQWANVSPGQYRIKKKMDKAITLLSGGQLSISEISGLLGYGDIYSFSSHFKKVTGVSPRYFRGMV